MSVLVSCTPNFEFPAIPTNTSKSRQHNCFRENNGTWKHKPHADIEMYKQDAVGKGLAEVQALVKKVRTVSKKAA